MASKIDFENLFKTANPKRDAFASRLLGIFSEEIVRIWCRDQKSQYEDLGRPSVYDNNGKYLNTTLDFTLKDKDTSRVYIAEMKCEIQFLNYKFLTLAFIDQIEHHKTRSSSNAFNRFLELTNNPQKLTVKINKQDIAINGGILVWGKVDQKAKSKIIDQYLFADIISLEEVVQNLIEWNNEEYLSFIGTYKKWTTDIFKGLV